MSRFGRLVFFLLAVLAFVLLAQWSYTNTEDPRALWEETQHKVKDKVHNLHDFWSHDDSAGLEDVSAASSIQQELKSAKIIEDVLDDFNPILKLQISWDQDQAAKYGNTLQPLALQERPVFRLAAFAEDEDDAVDEPVPSLFDEEDEPDDYKSPDISFPDDLDEEDEPDDDDDDDFAINDKRAMRAKRSSDDTEYVIVMTDPDAPSAEDPSASEFCHWIGSDVHLQTDDASWSGDSKDLMEYTPPAPPEGTGKHRYVFIAFRAKGKGTDRLSLTTPEERPNWGYGKERHGVRQWAEENNLVPVAANFIYTQHEKDF